MNIGELGEFELIRRIAPHFAHTAEGVLGIGDDCAVLPHGPDEVTLVTTDLLIENIHFLLNRIEPEDLGHKALAVNLSDIAGMGGRPTGAFLSIGLPKSMKVEWLDRFFAGIRALGEASGCPLLGGDTTRSEARLVINFAVLGTMRREHVKTRSGAKPGDVIAVTGVVGDSAAGLRLLLENRPLETERRRRLVTAHHRPMPHLEQGQWLAGFAAVHAMMDISDGIDSDLRHILERSGGLGARVELERLPLSADLRTVCEEEGWSAEELAASGGEDYGLLCTVDAESFASINRAYADRFEPPLRAIGEITRDAGLIYLANQSRVALSRQGFDHFTEQGG